MIACSPPNDSIAFAGQASSDGKTITGSYTLASTGDAGSLTATLNSGASGTYTGTVTSQQTEQTFPVTAVLTQNSDGSVTGSGMVSNSICVGSLTFANNVPTDPSFAVGGGFYAAADNPGAGVFVDVAGIPNGDGTYSLWYNLQTPSCSDTGTGIATKK